MKRTLKQCIDRIKPLCEARGILNYWEIREIFNQMERYAEILRILKPFMFVSKDYAPICFAFISIGANDEGELLNERDYPEDYKTIAKWLEEKE